MTEIFANIPEEVKKQTKYWIDLALRQVNPMQAVKMIMTYIDTCQNEEEKEFAEFYFKLQTEKLKNESDINFSEEPAR